MASCRTASAEGGEKGVRVRASWPRRGSRRAVSLSLRLRLQGTGQCCGCAPRPPPWPRPCGGGRAGACPGASGCGRERSACLCLGPHDGSHPPSACSPPVSRFSEDRTRASVRTRVAVGTKLGFVVAPAPLRPWVGWGGERGAPSVALSVGHVAAPAPPPCSTPCPSGKPAGAQPQEARVLWGQGRGSGSPRWADATHAESARRPRRAVSTVVARSHPRARDLGRPSARAFPGGFFSPMPLWSRERVPPSPPGRPSHPSQLRLPLSGFSRGEVG